MPFPTNSLLISMGGQHYTSESWSCRLRAASTTPVSDAALIAGIVELATVIQGGIAADFHDSSLFTYSASHLDFVKVAPLGPDGLYLPGADADLFSLAPGAGVTGSAGQGVPQATTVYTLRTALHRGHASRGRIYWPGAALEPVPVTGEIALATATGMRDTMASLLNAINAPLAAAFSSSMRLCIGSPLGAGVFRPITAVSVGRVIDTQRRRRRSLSEEYVPDQPLLGA